jgi:hypothetical protein
MRTTRARSTGSWNLRARKPSALALNRFDDVIIAALVAIVPPAAFDALGPGQDLFGFAAQYDRFAEQPEGPHAGPDHKRGFRAAIALRNSAGAGCRKLSRRLHRRCESPGTRRAMIGDTTQTSQGLVAEPCAQAFGEPRPIQFLTAVRVEEIVVQWAQRRQIVCA